MKSAIFAVLLGVAGACGTSGLHDVAACGSDWGSAASQCELACEGKNASKPMGLGPCTASNPNDSTPYRCIDTTQIDGASGCCVQGSNASDVVRFYECN